MTDTSGRSLKSCWPGFWTGLIGAVLTALFAMLLLPGFTMGDLERTLQQRAESALKADPRLAGWARVTMSGQRATLSGAAPNEELRQLAADVVRTAAGPGGDYAGGITRVQNDILVGQPVQPFTWSARRTATGLALSGHAPSQAVKDALVLQARQLFNAAPSDEVKVSPGAPPGDWRRVAGLGLELLANLKTGEARLVNSRLLVIGEGAEAGVAAVRARASVGPSPGYEVRADVTVEGQGFTAPELRDVNLSNPTPQACTDAFAKLMRARTITFAVDSATIDARSEPLLQNLVSVAVRCDQARIDVSGHTDATGDPARNVQLSQARANAVRDYLIERGVRGERIRAEGFGSARPAQVGGSAAALAANRRIEFNVVSEGTP